MSTTEQLTLHATCCAICGKEGNATELYPANFDFEAFNPVVFSARRLPDKIHYRLVKCNRCGLVRSDPVVDAEVLAQLYAQSSMDYGDEVANINLTYGRYLKKLEKQGVHKGILLEIGCGNGFVLEEALRQGYQDVRGVEPSADAIAKAAPSARSKIVCDVMRSGVFEPNQFDAICLFQTLDHLPAPDAIIGECFKVLKPGGLLLVLNHNVEAVSAKLLKERSPIFDIEHTYLYSPATLGRLCEGQGFRVKESGVVFNRYTTTYLTRMMPMPGALKRGGLTLLKRTPLGRLKLSLPLGNLYLIAQKAD